MIGFRAQISTTFSPESRTIPLKCFCECEIFRAKAIPRDAGAVTQSPCTFKQFLPYSYCLSSHICQVVSRWRLINKVPKPRLGPTRPHSTPGQHPNADVSSPDGTPSSRGADITSGACGIQNHQPPRQVTHREQAEGGESGVWGQGWRGAGGCPGRTLEGRPLGRRR